jgi:hypothetical protein
MLSAAFLLLVPVRAGAQYASRGFPATADFSTAASRLDAAVPLGGLLGSGEHDHRYTGFYVGLGVGAGLGIAAFVECADNTECAVAPLAFTLVGMAAFSVVGALLGSLIPK